MWVPCPLICYLVPPLALGWNPFLILGWIGRMGSQGCGIHDEFLGDRSPRGGMVRLWWEDGGRGQYQGGEVGGGEGLKSREGITKGQEREKAVSFLLLFLFDEPMNEWWRLMCAMGQRLTWLPSSSCCSFLFFKECIIIMKISYISFQCLRFPEPEISFF